MAEETRGPEDPQEPVEPERPDPTDLEEDELDAAPRAKPAIPGADLEVDIVREGEDALLRDEAGGYLEEDAEEEPAADAPPEAEDAEPQPIAGATIDLAAGARYSATGKRKTAVARVILKPGTGEYSINGRALDHHFPRATLQRNIRQPLEAVGYESRMDVVASMHGGGVSAQAGALRHGISRALIEADPNLRSELKRRGFLTRDARVKERKKAGLKKARKRPQFSKR
jgi:small subunit ribosomal protein S9